MTTIVLTILILCLSITTILSCNTDDDCFLNGQCLEAKCLCDAGWTGANCSLLNLLPAPVVGAYGYSHIVTSWGGIPILVGSTYHLYVAEMVNGCGLCAWGSNSRIVHATSDSVYGPYKFHDQAIPAQSHNPQIAVDYSGSSPTYLLFHIGDGSGHPRNCTTGITDRRGKENHRESVLAGGTLHTATSPDGPWIPQSPPGLGNCNNPAPYVFPNGTIYLVCTWSTVTAPSWKGPWKSTPFHFQGNGGPGNWEDPFIWVDKRGNWKLLSHVWISTGTHYADRVAGFAYSRDGINWIRSPTPPFDNKVTHVGGIQSAYTTRERPKIFLEPKDRTSLVALFNGVAGVPGGNKDKCGEDWTFTLAQPIAQ